MRRTSYLGLLSLALLLAGMSLAQAMLPPWVYDKARADAPYHIQVAIDGVKVPAKTPGDCQVSGKVVHIFRDTPGKLSDGDEITFPIACIRSEAEMFPGPAIWTKVKDLVDAHFIEVYLVDAEEGLDTVKWQSRLISEPSSTPQLPVK